MIEILKKSNIKIKQKKKKGPEDQRRDWDDGIKLVASQLAVGDLALVAASSSFLAGKRRSRARGLDDDEEENQDFFLKGKRKRKRNRKRWARL